MHLFPVSTNGGPTIGSPPIADTHPAAERAPTPVPVELPRLDLRVVLLVVSVVLGGHLAGQFAVEWGTNAAVETDAESRMALGFRLFENAAVAAQARLSRIAGDLSRDRGARGALASGSRAVADGALKAALARSGATHGALLRADGTLAAAALPEGQLVLAPLLRHARQHGALRTAAVIGDRAYLLAIEPMARPGVAAWALAAEALDTAFAAARVAGVSLRVAGVPGATAHASGDAAASPYRVQRALATPSGALQLELQHDAKDAARPFAAMRLALTGVGVLAVLAALLAGLTIARTRQRAITELLQAVARIRHGDYGRPPAAQAGTDLEVLARSFVRMQSSIAGREARIAHAARQGALAALASRGEALADVEEAIQTSSASRTPVTLVALGIAGFETLSTSLGPAASEDVLGELARRLESEARVADSVARLERSNFLIVLRDTEIEGGTVMARRLADACSRAVPLAGGTVALDIAAGIAAYPEHGADARALIMRATRALRVAEQIPGRVYSDEAVHDETQPVSVSA